MGGAPYEVTLRLMAIAGQNWVMIDGDAAMHGVNPMALRLDRPGVDVVEETVQRVKDPTLWTEQLNAPMPGQARKKPPAATMAQEGAGFTTFMAQMGAGQGVSRG